MSTTLDTTITQNFDKAIQYEWLETNGIGGWASSTIIFSHTRRYHGLLVAATHPPVGRIVLLSKLEDTIILDDQRYDLSCNLYPDLIHPTGYYYLHSFSRDIFPVFVYRMGGVVLRKTVVAVHGENTSLVVYEVLDAPGQFSMELQPFIAARDYHSMTHANDNVSMQWNARFDDGIFQVKPSDPIPGLFLAVPGATFDAKPAWYNNFEYHIERYRGLDCHEDLFTHGIFRRELNVGDTIGIIISTDNPAGRDAITMMEDERQRREALVAHLDRTQDTHRALTLAADQFIVKRGDNLRTIIAGYHWFSDWGRDTMIAMPGLCLSTGRFDDARKILSAFTEHISQGMLPNRFPDAGETPEYNTVDATLWFFLAVYHYLKYTGDEAFVRKELFPVLLDIIAWHEIGTRYGIRMDDDGLLTAGEPGIQLTWMDAKVGDWVVTPRHGKAVEVNALWFNALVIVAELAERFGDMYEARKYTGRANQVKAAFQRVFWNDEAGCLYDVVDGDRRESAIRPNQIFALSLPFPLLKTTQGRKVLKVVEELLFTPRGLRSLAPTDRAYCAHYGGDQRARDSAYHQGTVWGWLIGPFLDALIRIRPKTGRQRAFAILNDLLTGLHETGIGTLSEIFDGDLPHTPRGCIAQAWSVAEVLRVLTELGTGRDVKT